MSTGQRRRTTPPRLARPWPLPLVATPQSVEAQLRGAEQADSAICDKSDALVPMITTSDDPEYRVVTFLARDKGQPVYLQANKFTERGNPREAELKPIAGTGWRAVSVQMPRDWICSYHFLTADGVDVPGGVVALEDAPALPPTASVAAWRCGTGELVLPVSRNQVTLTVHSHPDASAHSPVVLLADGDDWLADDLPATALAAQIEAGDSTPIHLAYLPAVDRTARQFDYTADAAEQAALLERIQDVLASVIGSHGGLVLAGQSLGGLFSLLAAVRFRGLVVGAVAQSPSLWWPTLTAPYESPGAWFSELAVAKACAPSVLQVGRTEWALQRTALHAREFLRALDALVETPHDIVTGGHDAVWWRRTLAEGIGAVLRSLPLSER